MRPAVVGDDWIQTSTSGKLFPLRPSHDEIQIVDIAKGLAAQPRFSGLTVAETEHVYNVAQHSVLVADLLKQWGCDEHVQLQGLLHDAEEGLGFGDLAGPIKHDPKMRGYRELAKRLQRKILTRFGCEPELHWLVKQADLTVFATEARDLMQPYHPDWDVRSWPAALPIGIVPWSPRTSRHKFIHMFNGLYKGK